MFHANGEVGSMCVCELVEGHPACRSVDVMTVCV